jgi:tyrosyl-tRNA synthetase
VPDADLLEFRRAMELGSANPMEFKHRLAREIVTQFHDASAAHAAEAEFRRVVQGGGVPEDIDSVSIAGVALQEGLAATPALVDALVTWGLAASKNEARRLVAQNAVEVDGERVGEAPVAIRDGSIVRVGKRRYARVTG